MKLLCIFLLFLSFESLACVSGVGLSTSAIKVTFKNPGDRGQFSILRNNIKIAYISDKYHRDFVIDDQGLVEGETYEYSCQILKNGYWVQYGSKVKASTLAVNAPVFNGVESITRYIDGRVKINWANYNSSTPVRTDTFYILAFKNKDLSSDSLVFSNFILNDGTVNSYTLNDSFLDYSDIYFVVRACSVGSICDSNRKRIKF